MVDPALAEEGDFFLLAWGGGGGTKLTLRPVIHLMAKFFLLKGHS